MIDRLRGLASRCADVGARGHGEAPRFGGPCSAEELDELASLFRVELPKDYREFLLSCRRLFAPDIQSGYFLFSPIGIVDTSSQSGTPRRIRVATADFSGELPTMPIGGDTRGNLFLLSVCEDLHGSVWKWDHGIQPQPDGTLTHGVTPLAPTFADFLERVAEDWAHDLDDDSDWHYL